MKQIFTLLACVVFLNSFAQPKQLGTDTIYSTITVANAKIMVDTNAGNTDFVVLDVRTPTEFANAHIADAININYYDANFSAQLNALDHNKMYLLHCAAGSRSTPTFTSMQNKNFREVYHMNQGINAWIAAGYPTVSGYTALPGLNETKRYEFYPNPAQNFLFVQFEPEGTGKLALIDLQGKLLREEILHPGIQTLDVSNIPNGIYFLKIQSEKEVYTEKITIL